MNLSLGQLEKTIHQAFLRGANLRRWLSRPNCPEIIQRCQTLFSKLYGNRPDGTAHIQEVALAEDEPSKPSQDTPEDLRRLIHRRKVVLHARYRADGVIYARAETHVGNSLVLFYPHGDRTSAAIPGSIQYIYRLDGQLRFAVRRYSSPALETPDLFAQYPDFPARTWSTGSADALEEVEVAWVFCQFAQYSISDDYVVVLALNQVSSLYCSATGNQELKSCKV